VRDYEMELHRTFTVFDRGAGTTPPAEVDAPLESSTDLVESGD
jgi:hypothetical protein